MHKTLRVISIPYALPLSLPIWGDLEGWSRDPMFEKYPSISPYTYCNNNPVLFVDPTGKDASTHTDADGNVIAVFDDGDLGVYVHEGNKEQALAEVNKNYSTTNTSAGGLEVGKSLHALSFADRKYYNETGKARAANIKIDFGSEELTDRILPVLYNNISLNDYMNLASPGHDLDIKSKVKNGSLIFGFYGTPQDAGNFAAGIYAQKSSITSLIQFGYGAFNLAGNSKKGMAEVVAGVGLFTFVCPAGGMTTATLISAFGEDKLSQVAIDKGKEFYSKGKDYWKKF